MLTTLDKFYKVQLLTDGSSYRTWTRWGRVGDRGQMKMLGDGGLSNAMQEFEKKFKDKSGLKWANRGDEPKAGKYAYVERSYNPDSDDDDDGDADAGADAGDTNGVTPDSTLSPPVQDLMKLIFNQVRIQCFLEYPGGYNPRRILKKRKTIMEPGDNIASGRVHPLLFSATYAATRIPG